MENKKLVSVSEAISETMKLIKVNSNLIFLISLIYAVLVLLFNYLLPVKETLGLTEGIINSTLNFLLAGILLPPLFLGAVVWVLLKSTEGEKIDFSKALNLSAERYIKLLVVTILQLLFIIVGLVLLIVPGVILGVWFFAADYLVVEKNLGPWRAFV